MSCGGFLREICGAHVCSRDVCLVAAQGSHASGLKLVRAPPRRLCHRRRPYNSNPRHQRKKPTCLKTVCIACQIGLQVRGFLRSIVRIRRAILCRNEAACRSSHLPLHLQQTNCTRYSNSMRTRERPSQLWERSILCSNLKWLVIRKLFMYLAGHVRPC